MYTLDQARGAVANLDRMDRMHQALFEEYGRDDRLDLPVDSMEGLGRAIDRARQWAVRRLRAMEVRAADEAKERAS